jgi:uncharacterized protein
MRRDDTGQIILSASDLVRFQGCQHATWLDLEYLKGADLKPAEDLEESQLVQKKGDEHERGYLNSLQQAGRTVDVVDKDTVSFSEAAARTRAIMAAGPEIIYQAALGNGRWAGYADFLERVPVPSALGSFSYEPIDTKLKRSPHPSHALQLALYSELLAQAQGRVPEHIHIVLGDGHRVRLPVRGFSSFAKRMMERLDAFIASPVETDPEPVEACGHCRWRDHCHDQWDRSDSTWLVAGITRSQHRKLESAGLTTLPELVSARKRPTRLSVETWEKLRTQADLQLARRRGGPPAFKLRPLESGRGLARLPEPDQHDLFFDMEGDPLVPDGLEYLFGMYRADGAEGRYEHIWAHDKRAEEAAVRAVLGRFIDHLKAHPRAHIYHYGDYEVAALKRLASRYGVGEELMDQLLRRQAFVNLLRVVKQGMFASEPSYSLKDLEVFYFPARAEAVASGTDSIVAYERYRDSGDLAILEQIRAYNEADCRSTRGLRDWLVSTVRPKGYPWYTHETSSQTDDVAGDEDPHEAARAAWRAQAKAAAPRLGQPLADLLFELCFFHRREERPAWWTMFDRADREPEDLIEDLESLAGLEAIGPPKPDKRSQIRRYRYPDQETKLRVGSRTRLRTTTATVSITEMNPQRNEVTVKFGPSAGNPPDSIDLIPAGPIESKVLSAAVRDVAADMFGGGASYPAVEALLRRDAPRLKKLRLSEFDLATSSNPVGEVSRVIAALDQSCLPIQGPPGTGKTYVASVAILELVQAGKRVAVAAHAHKAIDNLLLAIVERAKERSADITIVKRRKTADEADDLDESEFETAGDNDDPRLNSYQVVGGTAWLFARDEHRQQFDYLVVDEAGQMSLANAVAAGTCARNIVLVGDPMQLPQPLQGAHPAGTGLSSLEHFIFGHPTVPPDRGLFLPRTRRLHSAVCEYISELAYEGRLSNLLDTDNQAVLGIEKLGLSGAGLTFVEVAHEGNSQSSEEEALALDQAFRALLGCRFRDRNGKVRNLTNADVLVVSPYNAQVNLLRRTLPEGARVGTVDRFQGQEAPVCLISMATSSGDELPRNIEFLFSTNRLNVAVSRAQAVAVIYASPRLLDVPCRKIEQVQLVNGLCLFRDMAKAQSGGDRN